MLTEPSHRTACSHVLRYAYAGTRTRVFSTEKRLRRMALAYQLVHAHKDARSLRGMEKGDRGGGKPKRVQQTRAANGRVLRCCANVIPISRMRMSVVGRSELASEKYFQREDERMGQVLVQLGRKAYRGQTKGRIGCCFFSVFAKKSRAHLSCSSSTTPSTCRFMVIVGLCHSPARRPTL